MIPNVMFDLRTEDLHTQREMDEAMGERLQDCNAEFETFVPVAIVMHESQVKWLKLELYESGKYTATQLKQKKLEKWHGIPVITTDEWEGMPCPNCGHIHEDEQAWYDEG